VGRTGRGVINLGWAEMRIGKQTAWRDINNYEIDPRGPDPDLRRRVDEVVALVEEVIRSGAIDSDHAAELRDASRVVSAAAARPERGRLLRALDGLKNLSVAAASTAGIAEATETIIHSVTGT
jgi:hypothetical protein